MKIGDRVKLLHVRYPAMGQQVGDEGFISNEYWTDDTGTCFGVTLDRDLRAGIYVGDMDWAYLCYQLEVIG